MDGHFKYLPSLNDISSFLNLETQSNVVQFADSFHSEKAVLTWCRFLLALLSLKQTLKHTYFSLESDML